MKEHRTLSDKASRAAEKDLYEAILSLQSQEECRKFFNDLCTPSELEAMIDRWHVVGLLQQGLPYRQINDLTGVSVTTIGRVARCLAAGDGGYELVCKRLSL